MRWRCRKHGRNGHQSTQSIRKHSWFEKSNLKIAEIIKLTYWWSRNVSQDEMEHELNISSATNVDWYNFAREVCEILVKKSQPIGGPGIRVEIDEAKFGKRKYHRGRIQEGQWVFEAGKQKIESAYLWSLYHRELKKHDCPLSRNGFSRAPLYTLIAGSRTRSYEKGIHTFNCESQCRVYE